MGPFAAVGLQLRLPAHLGRRLGWRPEKQHWRFLEFPVFEGVGGTALEVRSQDGMETLADCRGPP